MIGKTVGHYRILSKIGAGGMGEVFLAEDARLERKAAIKFLAADTAHDPQLRRRFLHEAKLASALNHPHICVVYDVGETEDAQPFIAMEFIEGDPLDSIVSETTLRIRQIVDISSQVVDALSAAHDRGIVHRDIKLSNITINKRGQVKVLDFGLAKRLSTTHDAIESTADQQQTQAGQVLGTPAYMSPEQALGREFDHRTDIFSVGVVLYRLITGQLPFAGNTLAETLDKVVHQQPTAIARLNYEVPEELERITLKCLQKSPDRRYQTATDLSVDLQNLARELDSGQFDSALVSTDQPTQTLSRAASPSAAFSDAELSSCDVLLNYATIDDQPLLDGKPGWVSQLHRNLEIRMEQLSGEQISVARLAEGSVPLAGRGELMERLPEASAMISVVSPPFIRSEVCLEGVEHFWNGAERTGGRWVDDKSRLLKVLKTLVPNEELPPIVADIFSPLSGFEFFELDPATGRVREFDETFGPLLKQRFFERVYDLAYDACQVVKRHKGAQSSETQPLAVDPDRRWVYLATTTSDMQDQRDRIKRELLERGHVVLPDGPLPTRLQDVELAVQEWLTQCTIAIHLLGEHYGVTPEDSAESLQALQVRLTADYGRQSTLQRLVWIPGGADPADERQRDFVVRVQEDPELHHRAEVIEGNLNLLKKDLIRRLAPTEQSDEGADASSPEGPRKVYIICDPRDEADIESLEDYLFDRGLEVSLPAFDGDDADAAQLHQENLLTCDAVLVYYGVAPKAWVDIKLRESMKAAGYERDKPIEVQAVYIAPPVDRRKERYRTRQAEVIRQHDDALASAALDTFIGRVKEVTA